MSARAPLTYKDVKRVDFIANIFHIFYLLRSGISFRIIYQCLSERRCIAFFKLLVLIKRRRGRLAAVAIYPRIVYKRLSNRRRRPIVRGNIWIRFTRTTISPNILIVSHLGKTCTLIGTFFPVSGIGRNEIWERSKIDVYYKTYC